MQVAGSPARAASGRAPWRRRGSRSRCWPSLAVSRGRPAGGGRPGELRGGGLDGGCEVAIVRANIAAIFLGGPVTSPAMNTMTSSFARACLIAGVFALAACPGGESMTTDTDATTDATAGTDTTAGTDDTAGTDAMTTAPTSTTETTETTETSAPTSTEGTTEATTTEEPGTTTGGEVSPEVDAACQSLCEKFVNECESPEFGDVASCKLDCTSDLPGGDEACTAATVAAYQCASGLTCEELLSENLNGCAAESLALVEACSAEECEEIGSSEGPDTCSYGFQCVDGPAEEIRCEGDTCTCLVDGEPTGTCGASEGFCALEPDEKADISFECCGFEF